MATSIKKLKAMAEELYLVRNEIRIREERQKEEMDVLKLKRDKAQEDLLRVLAENDLASIKTSSGDSFCRSRRKGYEFSNEIARMNLAMTLRAVRPDSRMLDSMLSKMPELPPEVRVVETEYISVRKAKKEGEGVDNSDTE